MKPVTSILDRSFVYTPAAATAIHETWRRHGWQPLKEQDRKNGRCDGVADCGARVFVFGKVRAA